MYIVLRLPHGQFTNKLIQNGNPWLSCNKSKLVPSIATLNTFCGDNRKNEWNYKNQPTYYQTYTPAVTARLLLVRNFSVTRRLCDKEPLKPSSKVEVTVQELKKKQEESEQKNGSTVTTTPAPTTVVKKSLKQRVVDEILHYYHGFRLLFIDIKITTGLLWRVLKGKSLSRREHRLMTRTVGDIFRLVPFSVFIIVPFMELLLPVFIKLFPGMLPSTFQTAKEREDKIKQNLKVKLEMAKFLQGTLDEMSVQSNERSSQRAKEFNDWFVKVRTSGEQVSNQDIMKFSKLFEDEITLDSLSRSQLIALCRVLEVQTLGTNNFLRFQLRMKLRSLAADDKMIMKEGIDSLTLAEVQQACRARGMRAYGMSEERLRNQLQQWLDLSLNEKVPPSLLLLSRALMLPETIPTEDKLKATISALPETIVKQTQASIQEKEGSIDNKTRLEALREEERKIQEERKEHREEKKKELELEVKKKDKEQLVDKAPVLSAEDTAVLQDAAATATAKIQSTDKEEHLQSKDFEIIEHAIDTVSKEKKLIVEKEEIEELKTELLDYEEDVQDLQKVMATQPEHDVKETKAAKRLFKNLNRMIAKLDGVMVDLEAKEKELKRDLAKEETTKKKEELMKIDDIIDAIKQIFALKNISDQNKMDQITKVLQKMDDDRDGSLKVEDILKVIEIIGKENVKLSSKQIDELIELLEKEEILEVEDKIEKALQKDKDTTTTTTTTTATTPIAKPVDKESNSGSEGTVPPSSSSNSSNQNCIPKNKMDTKGPALVPPTVNSIDKNKNSSKML